MVLIITTSCIVLFSKNSVSIFNIHRDYIGFFKQSFEVESYSLLPPCRRDNKGSERLSDLFKATQIVKGRPET